jgi:EAL domain-containing protein (putative c-di-GMP-specific phosphodiesterase class I)
MENAEFVIDTLMQLKAMDVLLDIDDFGTGYSSLSYLHRFPIDALKIDRSFTSKMDVDKENLEIIKTIVTLARNLGKKVIVEGVENENQLSLLKELKCDYAQGYFFSKPVDGKSAETLLVSQQQK